MSGCPGLPDSACLNCYVCGGAGHFTQTFLTHGATFSVHALYGKSSFSNMIGSVSFKQPFCCANASRATVAVHPLVSSGSHYVSEFSSASCSGLQFFADVRLDKAIVASFHIDTSASFSIVPFAILRLFGSMPVSRDSIPRTRISLS